MAGQGRFDRVSCSGGARNESKEGPFSPTNNQGGRSLFLVGGARDWINHKLIKIDGLRQPVRFISQPTADGGDRQTMETVDRGMTRRQGMSGDAPVTSALRAVCNF